MSRFDVDETRAGAVPLRFSFLACAGLASLLALAPRAGAEMPYPGNPMPCRSAAPDRAVHRGDRLRPISLPAGDRAAHPARRLRQRQLEADQRSDRRPADRRQSPGALRRQRRQRRSRLAGDHRAARRADRRARLRHPLAGPAARPGGQVLSQPRRAAGARGQRHGAETPTTATATASSTSATTWPTTGTRRTRASATRTATASSIRRT